MGNFLIFHLTPSNLHSQNITNTKEILSVSIFKILNVKFFQKLFDGNGLFSCGRDISFNIHVAISILSIFLEISFAQ